VPCQKEDYYIWSQSHIDTLDSGVMVSFRMVDFDADEDENQESQDRQATHHHLSEGMKQSKETIGRPEKQTDRPPRGLCIALTWLHNDKQALQVNLDV
jgi:hypothetical protein